MRFYIETYGCQMNVGDTQIVVALLEQAGFSRVDAPTAADLILINTCSIRDNAEQRVFKRLTELKAWKRGRRGRVVGVIGCMASRLSDRLFERGVSVVAGPDAYRSLPRLIRAAFSGEPSANTELSAEETYADVAPVRADENGVTAFVSIMRGCNNFCAYCVVPYTRGRERSRPMQTIVEEARGLFERGYKEVTLLGQNVNSYDDFPRLLAQVAEISPRLRVRFATSHPKDMSDELLDTMVLYPNICRQVHLPAQSGSTAVLQRMNRKYTREWYLDRVKAVRDRMPDCGISTDLIAGFCGETAEDHAATLSLMREVGYDFAFMFKYSERPDTFAARNLKDDVPEAVKAARLAEIIALQNTLSARANASRVGTTVEVLVEGAAKRGGGQLSGRTSQGNKVVFTGADVKPGDYVTVRIAASTAATLKGIIV